MPIFDQEKLKATHRGKRSREEPLWKGPENSGPMGGITYSLLCRFLVCRERFRICALEGLRPTERFNHRIEYGNMWHACEEALAAHKDWRDYLSAYVQKLCEKYPLQQDEVLHWGNVCSIQFPCYEDHWAHHPDVKGREPLLQEHVFQVPYELPTGRKVWLKGKYDSVDWIEEDNKSKIMYLQEDKTKGDINEGLLHKQLASGFDLQTMLYMVALERFDWRKVCDIMKSSSPVNIWKGRGLAGVRYNVVRRPLSGGRGTIRVNKGESLDHFYQRLGGIIGFEPEYYFMRWKVNISESDIKRFCKECLDPILEQLCWWYDIQTTGKTMVLLPISASNWRHPYGVWSPLDDGGMGDLDEYLRTGSEVGLHRATTLFPELDVE